MTEEAGLVHSSGNYRDGIDYFCNCCTCCCGIMRGIAEYGIMSAVARADFQIAVDAGSCVGCGACVGRCQFKALSLAGPAGGEAIAVDLARCMGCGLCVLACPRGALRLERRKAGEAPPPPADIAEWRALRASGRG